MGREKGTLIRWDDVKGYGFIRSHQGNMEIYLHIKALPNYQRRPKIGDVVTYHRQMDEKGRYYTLDAQIKGLAWSRFTFAWACLALLFGTYLLLLVQQKLPFHFLAIYVGMSLLTIWVYSSDKRAAQLSKWRTAEITLHTLEALGGWPGALLAQSFYRHKRQKRQYQIVFWLIVVGHGLLWYHILTNQEKYRPYQDLITEKVQILIDNTRRETGRLLAGDTSNILEKWRKLSKSSEKSPSRNGFGRSIIPPLKGARIVQGIVKEVRPGEGVVVSLDRGMQGMIARSTLVRDFSQLFRKEELVQVAVQAISFDGSTSRAELILVDQ
ncbi:MAG: DUF1294 domain-containing protein [Pseudomonadota bacterium]